MVSFAFGDVVDFTARPGDQLYLVRTTSGGWAYLCFIVQSEHLTLQEREVSEIGDYYVHIEHCGKDDEPGIDECVSICVAHDRKIMQGSIQTEGRVALVRHARSSHVHVGWITASGFRAWREAYEAAGIRLAGSPNLAAARCSTGARGSSDDILTVRDQTPMHRGSSQPFTPPAGS